MRTSKPELKTEAGDKMTLKELGIDYPLRAIRKMCLRCVGGQTKEVRVCTDVDCPLWPFRMKRKYQSAELLRHEREVCAYRGKLSRERRYKEAAAIDLEPWPGMSKADRQAEDGEKE